MPAFAPKREADSLYRRSIPNWKLEIAEAVETEIKRANRDAWPVTLRQLRAVAQSFGKQIDLASECPLPGLLVDDMICVARTGDELTDFRRIVHEIAHAILASGALPPMVVAIPSRDLATAHQIAAIVEAEYAAWLRFVRAGDQYISEQRASHKQARTAEQPALTYERDEHADPDFDGNDSAD